MTLSKCVNFIHFGLKIFEIIIDYFIIRINRVIETHSFYKKFRDDTLLHSGSFKISVNLANFQTVKWD